MPTPNRTDTFYAIADDVKTGYGNQLLVGCGNSPETFVAITGVSRIKGNSLDTVRIKATHLRSPNAAQEYVPGMRDYSALSCTCRWLPDDDTQRNQDGNGTTIAPGLLSLSINRTIVNLIWRLFDGSPATEIPFRGFVSKYEIGEANEDGLIDLNFEVSPVSDYTGNLP